MQTTKDRWDGTARVKFYGCCYGKGVCVSCGVVSSDGNPRCVRCRKRKPGMRSTPPATPALVKCKRCGLLNDITQKFSNWCPRCHDGPHFESPLGRLYTEREGKLVPFLDLI